MVDLFLRSARLLRQNQVERKNFYYTMPSPVSYRNQWLWDSCFHAIAWRHFDVKKAQDELISIVSKQLTEGYDYGMIPHKILWSGKEEVGEVKWIYGKTSNLTQPPLLSIASKLVYEKSKDKNFLLKIYPHLVAYHSWFDRRRSNGDCLVSIIHPWESGWDASPHWDNLLLGASHPSSDILRKKRFEITLDIARVNCDLKAIVRNKLFNAVPIDFNAIRAADLEALGFIAKELDQESISDEYIKKVRKIQSSVSDLLVRNVEPDSLSKFVALFGGCATGKQAKRFAEELQNKRFWTPHPLSTVSTDSVNFRPNEYWRGNVWIPVNWLIIRGLERYGYQPLADLLKRKTIQLVMKSGLWEYYNPINGQGLGAKNQSWSALIADLIV